MSKIPFKVSARTARLIGRENIASSKGAIIEIVKNAYDADSPVCIVFFDNKYSILHDSISMEEYEYLKHNNINQKLYNQVYQENNNTFTINDDASDEDKKLLKEELNKLNSLYIIDAGEGMTQQIIKNHWMTIGTDNKAVDVFTKKGRVKAGAKGIGRFALDKLGNHTEMITIFDNKSVDKDDNGKETDNCGYLWKVNWSDFEGDFKTIETVKAEFNGIQNTKLKEQLAKTIHNSNILELIGKYQFDHGTLFKITELRDRWEDFYVKQIFSDLEMLVPPKEERLFDIFLLSSLKTDEYGEVKGSVCDDFDYKLVAEADDEQNISISICRNEYDLDLIEPEFFKRDAFKKFPYRKKDFEKGIWETEITLSQLLPGFKDVDRDNIFENIGIFNFTFYFMKKTYSSPDAEKYFYRKFKVHERKEWLDKFGGIKLFRDNFRVRPYGEVNDSAFDWLGLGARKAKSPAGVGKKEGGYRVNPDNIAGAIKISRLANVDFEDKSSREGLQENKTFLIFKEVIAKIISLFEDDRAYISNEMKTYYNDKNFERIEKEKAEKIAKSILGKSIDGKENDKQKADVTDNEVILAKLNREKEEEIEKLKDEQKVLRGLASSGIVMASFTHELSNLDDVLNSRIDELKEMIYSKVTDDVFSDVPDYLNPFIMLEEMKKQDSKIQNWLRFSIGSAKKDKRTRKKLSLKSYFENFKTTWRVVLDNRKVDFSFKIVGQDDFEMRIFEIDLDSIFNNLLVNSIDAFLRSDKSIQRSISVIISESTKWITISYYDNGPGLSKDIMNPNKIFEALYTTKRNQYTGNEEGTGLGMWLVKIITEDNDAKAKLLFPKNGFGIRFLFPIKYKR